MIPRLFRCVVVCVGAVAVGGCTTNGSSTCSSTWSTSDDFSVTGRAAAGRAVLRFGTATFAAGTTTDPAQTGIVRRLRDGSVLWSTVKTYSDRTLADLAATPTRLFAVGRFAVGGWSIAASSDGTTWADLSSGYPTGQALKAIISGAYLVVIGSQNATDTIVAQRVSVGLSAMESSVVVGAGRPAGLWANRQGHLFLLANYDDGSDAKVFTSTDNGLSWSQTALTVAVAAATKAAFGGDADAVYAAWVDAGIWKAAEANLAVDGLGAARTMYTLSAGFQGFPKVLLSARSDEVVVAGDVSSSGVSSRWQTALVRPLATGTPRLADYQLVQNAAAQVLGGGVADGDYFLAGSARDAAGDDHWIVRQLKCAR